MKMKINGKVVEVEEDTAKVCQVFRWKYTDPPILLKKHYNAKIISISIP